ncbi:MAG: AAA family ATPase [Chloroflexota bacterium]
MQKFPYGVRKFADIIEGNYVYIDRTDKIRFIEEWGKKLLFLRPRRFGKSLWLSTMMDYYDVAKADRFEQLFGHLKIGQNPTPLHSSYMVMRWDFSRVKSHVSVEEIEADLHDCINSEIKSFQVDYQHMLQAPIEINQKNALLSFYSALDTVRSVGYKLYLFIEEYDNFANEVMMSVQQRSHRDYESLVTGEGMFKTFFKNIKSFGSGRGLDRVFITGVTPIVMNDVTSGANVFEDIYWFDWFNDLCGFWEHEVADILFRVLDERSISPEQRVAKHAEALDMMRTHYDGSWFTTEIEPPDRPASTESRLYNPTMVFYFLRELQRTGKYPRRMLDRNLRADRGKLKYIASYSSGRKVLVKALNTGQEVAVDEIGTEFGADELLQDDMRQGRLSSLLCYLGALTINGLDHAGQIRLIIPNLVMKETYAGVESQSVLIAK